MHGFNPNTFTTYIIATNVALFKIVFWASTSDLDMTLVQF